MQKQEEKDVETLKKEIKSKLDFLQNDEQSLENKEPKTENTEVLEEKEQNKIEDKKVEVEKEEKQEETINKSDEEKKKNRKEKSNKKRWILFGIIFAIAILIFSVIFALININSDKIISGVSINGVEVSGLTKQEAKGKLETILNEKKQKDIYLKYQDYETPINPKLIEVNYDIDKVVEDAYNIGRESNIFANNYSILFTLILKKDINIESSLNEEITDKTLKDASSKIPGAIKEASYYIENENLIITKGTKGIAIDIEDTKNKIKEKLRDINSDENYIELLMKEKEPDQIDIDKIHSEVYKEAKDAYYTKEPFQVYPEVNGIDFNVEEAKALLKEDKDEYTLKLTITKPKVTIDQIGSEAFPDKLGLCTTPYDASMTNRTTNLRIACQKINGKVLLPGETFSYNKTLGERTIAAGYKEAAIYSAGKVVDGLGGGICQISSTLYDAVIEANLEIVERRNHQFVTSYLPAGKDATVVYGLTDFQFKNTRKHPIKINAGIKNGVATVSIYGIKEQPHYIITIETRTIATIPVSTKYIEDSTLPEGKEVVVQKGHTGVQTEAYKVMSLNGQIVSRTLLSKDTYNAMQRIIKRGTKKAQTTQAQPTTSKPETQVTQPTTSKPETQVTKPTDKKPESQGSEAKPTTDKKPSTETDAEKKPESEQTTSTNKKPTEDKKTETTDNKDSDKKE